jgi:hypothetical protein
MQQETAITFTPAAYLRLGDNLIPVRPLLPMAPDNQVKRFASIFKIDIAGVEIGVEPEAEPGFADSGDLQYDLADLFEVIGQAAQAARRGWILRRRWGDPQHR